MNNTEVIADLEFERDQLEQMIQGAMEKLTQ